MRALLSVSDKSGLIPFASALSGRGWEIVSTGGTARALSQAGLAVTAVSAVTQFPEMMDGRVKTLHPAVHGGILARRGHAGDLAALKTHGITPIDLVVVNLYPFARAAAQPDLAFDALVEEIDIGGPSLVRAAAKNFRDVLVVVDPSDYEAVMSALASGGDDAAFRLRLAQKAFAHTAAYDRMIATTLADVSVADDTFVRRSADLPALFALELHKIRDLRYGENPHLAAAWYADGRHAPPAGLGAAQVLQGKELSFTNLLDLDAAARLALEFDEPAAAVIKHTNPCGAATGGTIGEAYVRAREADPVSAFGGIVGLNRPVDLAAAQALTATFIEAVIAPGVVEDAKDVLATKPNMRVVVADFGPFTGSADIGRSDERVGHRLGGAGTSVELRSLLGAVLAQHRDTVEEARVEWPGSSESIRVVSNRQPTAEEWQALRFAWRVCAHVKSNAVVFTAADHTLAVGAGQTSRVDAVKVAMLKAGDKLRGASAASDAFFPFRDGLDAIAAAGATAVVQPGGSVRDAEVIAAANEHGIAMVFTGRRHFSH